MSTRFLVPSNVGPAGPPGPEGPEGPPGDAKALIDDTTISTSKTYSSFKVAGTYQPLLTTSSGISVNSVVTNGLSSLFGAIQVAKNLSLGTNVLVADSVYLNTLTSHSATIGVGKSIDCGTNTINCGAATCTSLSSSNGNIVAGTGTVSAATMTTNTLTSTGASLAVTKALALGSNSLTCGSISSGHVSCTSMNSLGGNITTANGNIVMGTGDLSCDTIASGQVTSSAGNVKLNDGSITDQAHIGFRATARPGANSRSYGLLRYNNNASSGSTAENKPWKLFYDQNNSVYGSTDPGTIQNQLEQASGAPLIVGPLTCESITGNGALTGVTANASIINAGTFAAARIPALPISGITGLSTLVDDIGVATSNLVVPMNPATPQWLTPLTFVRDTCGLNGAGLAMFSFRETTNGNANRCYSRMYQFSYRRSDFSGDSSSGTVTQIGANHDLSLGTLTLGAITLEDDKVNSTSPYQVRFLLASLVSTSSAVGYSVTVRIYGNVL